MTAGTYEWRLYASDSNTRLATSGTLTVTATTATLGVNGTAAPNPLTVVAGTNLVVTLANGPGNPGDWIALAPVGAPPTTIADWRYLNNTTVAPTSGMTSATVTVVAPTTTGDYELRLFPATQPTALVTSGVVTVTASTAALTVNGTSPPTAVSVNAGTFVTVGASNGPANQGDWVGLYTVGAPDAGALVWQYLNGSTTPPTTGSAGASLSFSIPNVSGSFEFRFFSSGSYVRLATSTSLVVAGTQLSVNGVAAPGSTSVSPGSQAIVSVGSGPGYVGDWVGLYAAGESDYDMLDWRYLNDTATAPSSGLTAATLHFAVPTTPGTYEFRFFIDDTYGRLATSGAMVVQQAPPVVTVALTSPFPGTTFNGPASLVVAANATVSGGTIQRVDFYDGATLIGTAPSAPYATTWLSPGLGMHTLTATAVVQSSAAATSTPIAIVVAPGGATLGTLGEPVASPPPGVYGVGQVVALTAVPGASIYYTVDGSQPDAASPIYSGPLTLSGSTTVRAMAGLTGWSNSAVASGDYAIDTVGPTILATVSPTPNPYGWNTTPVTVSFECTDASAVNSCPNPVVVSHDGANQSVSAVASDILSNETSATVTVNIDSSAPSVSMTSPAVATSTAGTTIAVTGLVDDALSGLTSVLCNGQPANLTGSAVTCDVDLYPGVNSVLLSVLDAAGNSASASARVVRHGTPNRLSVSPGSPTLTVGESRRLTAVSEFGPVGAGVTWDTSVAGIVTLSAEAEPTLTAEAPGVVTLTASVGALTATTTVTVALGPLSVGTPVWTAAPAAGLLSGSAIYAHRQSEDSADVFAIDTDPATQTTQVRALDAYGRVLWAEHAPAPPVFGDVFGGIVGVTPNSIVRFGGGGASWRHDAEGSIDSKPVQTPAGLIVAVESQAKILALDGATGGVAFRTDLPQSVLRSRYVGACQNEPSTSVFPDFVGPMTVGDDGAVYFQLFHQSVDWTISDCPSGEASTGVFSYTTDLHLARLSPTGDLTKQLLYHRVQPPTSTTQGDAEQRLSLPGPSAPDGQGGILASWDLQTFHGLPSEVESHVAVASGGSVTDHVVVSRFALGSAPPDASSYSPLEFVGDAATVILKDLNGVKAVDATTWTTKWSSPEQGRVIASDRDGGVTMIDSGGALHQIDATGATTSLGTLGVSDPVQLRLGMWSGTVNGALTAVWGLTVNESVYAFDAKVDPNEIAPQGRPQGGGTPNSRVFATREKAALAALEYLYPASSAMKLEWGGKICRDGSKFLWSELVKGLSQSEVDVDSVNCQTPSAYAARLHTHPPNEHPFPSGYLQYGGDYHKADQNFGAPAYLMAPAQGDPNRTDFLKYWNPFSSVVDASRLNTCRRQPSGAWTPIVVNPDLGAITGNCSTPTP